MSLTTAIRRWLVDDDDVVYECRNCGTTLERTDRRCPDCGSTDISKYETS